MKRYYYLIMLLVVSACGPIYNTEYSYTPPESSGGHACIAQCTVGKSQCLQIEELKAERCESISQSDRDYCEADIAWRKGRDPKWYECVPDSCDVDTEQCENAFRVCYQTCGGKVEAVTRCVANCSSIPQQQAR